MKLTLLSALVATLVLVGCGSDANSASNTSSTTTTGGASAPSKSTGEKKTIAFVSNNAADFWVIAKKGTDKAQSELPNYTVEFKMPQEGSAANQKQILDDLAANGAKAIAVSPIDPKNQSEDLNTLASKCFLMTQDSDAPDSKREVYLGTDNIAAGRLAGEEIKKALPKGGKIMVFVGKADVLNAKERFQGVKEALKGSNVTVIDLRTDDTDRARAKQNVADTLVAYPDVAGLVGLWSYNGPAILNAVREAKKEGKVKIVTFDEESDTLKGVADGFIESTVVQQPFEFGYQSVKLMAKVLDGDKSSIPADKKILIPTKVINKANVAEFMAKMKELTGK